MQIKQLIMVATWSQVITSVPVFASPKTHDSAYESKVRTNLATFHPNLSKGNCTGNGPLVSFPMQWNVNGQLLISRKSFVSHLCGFNTTFHGLKAPDVYHIVDGNVGAILYHLQATQTAPVGNIPLTGRRVELMGGELMVFDEQALLDFLITIEEDGRLVDQLTGVIDAPKPFPPISLISNPQTSSRYRSQLRKNMARLHQNFNEGNNLVNAALARSDIQVNADYVDSTGQEAFVALFVNWQKAFPDMVYRDDYILADGHQGAIEYVWEGTQTGPYTAPNSTVIALTSKPVRVRGMLFLEFDDQGLVAKATSVHDEAVVVMQLQTGELYP
jgi:predicted ester cyclase